MSFSYVVFTNSDNGFIKALLKDGFSHCYMLYIDRGKWIVHDTGIAGSVVFTLEDISDIVATSTLIEVETKKSTGLFSLNTCVSIVKHAIGVNNPLILTPYQLYKRLL
ncbi:MAG: hypothetical protein GY829_12450 [Gammaproteobacteria bacterium]|nr:hypothetical protein [Gammaproteobacteria bacterium]